MGDVGIVDVFKSGRSLGVSCEGRRVACNGRGGGPISERLPRSFIGGAIIGPPVELDLSALEDLEDHSGFVRSCMPLGESAGEIGPWL